MDLANLGFIGLVTFGLVSAVSFFKDDLTTQQKFLLSVVIAFGVGFVPQDLGSVIANKVKDAIAIASAVNGGFQWTKKIWG